jgi:hypothetical protein
MARRQVAFVVHGGTGGSFKQSGDLTALLDEVPDFLTARLVPPLRVVNDLLHRGYHDAGMSGACEWTPFQITEPEWRDLAEALTSRRADRCEVVESPEWVATYEDWHAWIMIFKYGLPEQFRDLNREHGALERAYRDARDSGNGALALALYERMSAAGDKLSAMVMKHVSPKHG